MTQSESSRLDRIERILEQTAALTAQNSTAIAGLQESVTILTSDVTVLTTAIADYIVEAEEDRQLVKQNQADIKRILDYLYNRNGGSPPPQ